MLGIKRKPLAQPLQAARLALELFVGLRRPAPHVVRLSPRLAHLRRELEKYVRELGYQVKRMYKVHGESIITNQMIQRRLSEIAIWLHAMTCSLSRVNKSLEGGMNGQALDGELRIVEHVCALAREEIEASRRGLDANADETMRRAAQVALRQVDLVPNAEHAIPEATPDTSALGTGKAVDQTHIQQFGAGSVFSGERVSR
jgi:hypothetical protein